MKNTENSHSNKNLKEVVLISGLTIFISTVLGFLFIYFTLPKPYGVYDFEYFYNHTSCIILGPLAVYFCGPKMYDSLFGIPLNSILDLGFSVFLGIVIMTLFFWFFGIKFQKISRVVSLIILWLFVGTILTWSYIVGAI